MDSYVIRIYRRDEKNPRKAAGQVEHVERGLMKSFTSVEELVKILGLTEKGSPGQGLKVRTKAQVQSKKQVKGR